MIFLGFFLLSQTLFFLHIRLCTRKSLRLAPRGPFSGDAKSCCIEGCSEEESFSPISHHPRESDNDGMLLQLTSIRGNYIMKHNIHISDFDFSSAHKHNFSACSVIACCLYSAICDEKTKEIGRRVINQLFGRNGLNGTEMREDELSDIGSATRGSAAFIAHVLT